MVSGPFPPRTVVAAVLSGALLVLGGAGRVRAAAPTPITLDEALALAEANNPDLAAVRSRSEAQEMRRAAAARTAWPRVSLAIDLSRTDAPARVFAEKLGRGSFGAEDFTLPRLNDPSAIGHLGSALALDLPIDLAGTTRARVRSETAAARAASRQLAEAAIELRFRVTGAYGRSALAAAAMEATRHALDGARAREEVLAARVAEGAALQADLLRARTRRRQREADLARARGEEQAALAALAQALGTPAIQRRPEAPLPLPEDVEAGALEDWQARAESSRPLLAVGVERRSAAEWVRRAEERAAFPQLGAYASAFDDRWSGASRRSYALGVNLQWSFDPARPRRTAAARADESAAASEASAVAALVRTEVTTAWVRRAAAAEALAAARGGTEDGAEALRMVRERRMAGLATLTDELETEAAALAAELDELRARTELALADAALRRAAGAP